MARRGGRIGPRQTITVSSTSGIWSLSDHQQERGAFNWSGIAIVVESLVIAGGGGGGAGYNSNGGGGGGGYRSSVVGELSGGGANAEPTFNATQGVTYTITVGGGGSAGLQGSNSSISGSGLTTITSLGGGGGGHSSYGDNGYGNGGSGGGNSVSAAWTPQRTNRLGTAGQGYSGGTWYGQYYNGVYDEVGAGGGGAGSAGEAGGMGRGAKSSITGSSVGYAGGGAPIYQQPTLGLSNAVPTYVNDESNTITNANTTYGSGNATANAPANRGGGGKYTQSGGSGVVIVRVLQGFPVATTTGSPVVTTANGYRIYQFNASGSITF